MAAQNFFYETSHANYGFMFNHDDAEIVMDSIAEIKGKATALNQSNNSIYKVVAQYSSDDNGFQIFVAPHARYVELAESLLDTFKGTSKAYLRDQNNQLRQIRKKSFIEALNGIVQNFGSNHKAAIKRTVALIKEHYKKESSKLNNAVISIAKGYDMGVVKHQEYYSGLAQTWIEPMTQQA